MGERPIIPVRKGMKARRSVRTTFILMAALCLSLVRPGAPEQIGEIRLAAILKKSEEYCRNLEKAALDFVCQEEVKEASRYYASQTDVYRYDYQFSRMVQSEDHTPKADVYLYDYQFIRKGGEAREKRDLVSVNGKKKNIQDSSLHTDMVFYKNVFLGPVGLLSKFWQDYFDYKLIGEDTVNKEKAVVIEATPGPKLTEPHPYGRVWVREHDGSVLKIVWDQKSLGNFQSIEEWAKTQNAEPSIMAFSEYAFEKNGLRFPSRNFVENAVVQKGGQKYVITEISVRYKNYKFFTVETEIKY